MQWYNNNVPNVLLAPFQSYPDERTESFEMLMPVFASIILELHQIVTIYSQLNKIIPKCTKCTFDTFPVLH